MARKNEPVPAGTTRSTQFPAIVLPADIIQPRGMAVSGWPGGAHGSVTKAIRVSCHELGLLRRKGDGGAGSVGDHVTRHLVGITRNCSVMSDGFWKRLGPASFGPPGEGLQGLAFAPCIPGFDRDCRQRLTAR